MQSPSQIVIRLEALAKYCRLRRRDRLPGPSSGYAFFFAIVPAWALKMALLEPFAIAALMTVYFKTIEGQVVDANWERRLSQTSEAFRNLKDKATESFAAV